MSKEILKGGCQIAARRSTYSRLNKRRRLYKAKRKIEYCKAQTRANYRLRERSIFAVYPSWRFLDAKVRTWMECLREQLLCPA